jgi:CRP-like cAMP-binding protein
MSATTTDIISHNAFFKGIPDDLAATLAGVSSMAELRIGQLLVRVGEPAGHFYIVERGLLSIEVYAAGRDPIVVDQVRVGDVVGWSWLVAPYRWRFDARAVEPTSVIDFDAITLREHLEADPRLGYEVTKRFVLVMSRRLASARERLVEAMTEPH